jgi:hypothetical protein
VLVKQLPKRKKSLRPSRNLKSKAMGIFFDPTDDDGLFGSSKEFRDHINAKQKIEREKEMLQLQREQANKLQELELKFQAQREFDRLERIKEKESDRWFEAIKLIIAAILGGLITEFFRFIFK